MRFSGEQPYVNRLRVGFTMTGDDRGSDNLLGIAHFRPGFEWRASRFHLVITGVPTRQLALLMFRILKLGSLVTLGSLTMLGPPTMLGKTCHN